MKKLLILVLLNCGIRLQPGEILNHAARCYNSLNGYQDSFAISLTKLERGTKTVFSITGKTFFKNPGLIFIDVRSPEKIKIFANGDSLTYYLCDQNNYYRIAKPKPLDFERLRIFDFIKYELSYTVLQFLLNDPAHIIDNELDRGSYRYLGTKLINGHLVYRVITKRKGDGDTQKWIIDCESGSIYEIITTSAESIPVQFQIKEEYWPVIDPDLSDSIFKIDIPMSAVRI